MPRKPLNDCCWVCGSQIGLHIHEIFFGTSNRKNSIKYGLMVYLCPDHHNMSNEGVHHNRKLDLKLKRYGQRVFEDIHTREEFIKIFGRNYI